MNPDNRRHRLLFYSLNFLAALAFAANAGYASAQIDSGNSELQLSAGIFHAQGSDAGTIQGDVTYGYFLTPGWELGIKQAISATLVDGGSDTWIATTAPFITYNFHSHGQFNTFVPYLGGFVGAVWNDRDATGTLGPIAGLRYFVSDNTYLGLQYRYEWFFEKLELSRFRDDFDTVRRDRSDGNHVGTIGFGIIW